MRCKSEIEVIEAANQMLTIAILKRKAGIELDDKIWSALEMCTMTTSLALETVKEKLSEE